MRVMVTRPIADAAPLAERLISKGHEVLLEPLLSIQMRAHTALDLSEFQAVLLTSANGARALGENTLDRGALVLCVGAATVEAAQALGFNNALSADGDVDALAALVLKQCDPKDGPLLHVAGSALAGDLAGRLQAEGFAVHRQVLYDAVPSEALSSEAHTAILEGKLDAVALYSPRTAARFAALLEKADLAHASRDLNAICLSAAVAAALGDLPLRRKLIASRPNQESLLDLMGDALA